MIVGWDASRIVREGRTGTETYSRDLLRHMIPLALESGHRLRLYTRGPLAPEDVGLDVWPASVHVRRIGMPRLWTHVGLAAEVWRHPPHVLFIPAHVVPLFPPPHLPILVTVHDLGYEHVPQAHPLRQRMYLRWSTRHSVRRATHVLADSRATARDLEALYGVPREKITVVYPGFRRPPTPTPEAVRAVRARYDLHGPYILHLGTVHPRKNLLRLLDAFARVASLPVLGEDGRELGPPQLVLAGKVGWLAEPILRRARKPDLRGRVHFLGYVPDEDVPALLGDALALAFPSLYEGFGFPVLEAQALGVPVLTSRVSSLPEVGGKAAIYVDPLDVASIAEGLARLITQPGVRARLIREGRENVRRFSWPRAAEAVWQILQEMGRGR